MNKRTRAAREAAGAGKPEPAPGDPTSPEDGRALGSAARSRPGLGEALRPEPNRYQPTDGSLILPVPAIAALLLALTNAWAGLVMGAVMFVLTVIILVRRRRRGGRTTLVWVALILAAAALALSVSFLISN